MKLLRESFKVSLYLALGTSTSIIIASAPANKEQKEQASASSSSSSTHRALSYRSDSYLYCPLKKTKETPEEFFVFLKQAAEKITGSFSDYVRDPGYEQQRRLKELEQLKKDTEGAALLYNVRGEVNSEVGIWKRKIISYSEKAWQARGKNTH